MQTDKFAYMYCENAANVIKQKKKKDTAVSLTSKPGYENKIQNNTRNFNK